MSSGDRTTTSEDNEDLLEMINEDSDRSTKLGRRRLIEDLNEKKLLDAELNDYEFA